MKVQNEKIEFTVAYGGDALTKGYMDVKQLAPALLSMGELLDQANQKLNGDRAKIQVNVNADFRKGSFEITLNVNQLFDQVGQIVTTYSAEQILLFLGLSIPLLAAAVGIPVFGLIQLIKKLKDSKIDKTEKIGDKITIHATTQNGNNIVIESDELVFNFYNDPAIRHSLNAVLEPLNSDGIDEFHTMRDGKEQESITKKELPYFQQGVIEDAPPPLVDDTRKAIFGLRSLNFKPDKQWRLTSDIGTISAKIIDEQFLQGIEKGDVRLGKHDILEVNLQTKQWIQEGKIKSENLIVKVIKHHKMPEPGHLFAKSEIKK